MPEKVSAPHKRELVQCLQVMCHLLKKDLSRQELGRAPSLFRLLTLMMNSLQRGAQPQIRSKVPLMVILALVVYGVGALAVARIGGF